MKVFVDTNVLVSAFATRGLCSDVVRTVMEEHQLVTSALVLEELERNLQLKFKAPQKLAKETRDFIEQDAILATPARLLPASVSDESDIQILSAALAAESELFITGDKELLALKELQSLRLMSPRQFWDLIKQN